MSLFPFSESRSLNVDSNAKPARKGRVVNANRGTHLYVAGSVPTPADVEAFRKKQAGKKTPIARVYTGMGWGAIADDDAFPTLRMTVRGNTTARAGHASQDQFSFKCMEARFHTFAESRSGRDWVRLRSGKERMTMSFASLDKAVLQTSAGMPTWADEQSMIYRWITSERKNDNVLVSALNPGNKKLGLAIRREPRGSVTIEVSEPGQEMRVIRVSKQLRLL